MFHEHKQLNDTNSKSESRKNYEAILILLNSSANCLTKGSRSQLVFSIYFACTDVSLYVYEVCNINLVALCKTGYYTRRVKALSVSPESNRNCGNSKQVHEDLYNPSDPNDPNSDTYLMAIIQSVFSLKEYSTANAILTRAVLEAIFYENHLSTGLKVDSQR